MNFNNGSGNDRETSRSPTGASTTRGNLGASGGTATIDMVGSMSNATVTGGAVQGRRSALSSRAEALIDAINDDVARLHSAYAKAGLIASEPPSSSVVRMLGSGQSAARFRRDFLLFEASVRVRLSRLGADGGELKHVVVFGGNNVGKSTVVNILAAGAVASVSPEGGHTQRPFAVASVTPPLFEPGSRAFARFEPVFGQPPAGRFDCYGIAHAPGSVLSHEVVLWDTPDCDAVGSGRYLDGVIEAVAAADLLVYVTSIERYAVADIVEWIVELTALGIPIIECLNKTPRRHRQLVIDRQRNEIFPKMAVELGRPVPAPPIVALQNLHDGEEEDLWGPDHPEAGELRDAVLSKAAMTDRGAAARVALAYATAQVERVLMPARLEQRARETWKQEVTRLVASFVNTYEQHYLRADTVIEPFKRLNLEILNLIDPNIPGLKPTLSVLRWAMRWPSRLLLNVGRQVLAVFNDGSGPEKQVSGEAKAYSIAHTELLSTLGGLIDRARMDHHYHPFWDAVAREWDNQVRTLTEAFGTTIQKHMQETDRRIQEAAADIFLSLKQRPHLLRVLTVVKVSSDVAGVVIGFHVPTHGHIVYDLLEDTLVVPLLLVGVETSTETAVASYVSKRRCALAEALLQQANEIARRVYMQPLLAIGETALRAAGTMGIEDELLTRLPDSLRQLSQTLEMVEV